MKKLACLLLSFVFLICTGCVEEKNTDKSVSINSRNYIVYSMSPIPKSLVMLDSDKVREKDLMLLLFEGLVKKDSSGIIVPAIAEFYNVSKDGLSYTFKIRKNAYWSDGNTITAEDFVKFFSQILKPEMNNIYADELLCIYGVREYRKGKSDFNHVAITSSDYKTLEIRLNYPNANLINILSKPIYGLRRFEENLDNYINDYKLVSYSGAYKIKEIKRQLDIYLEKNENYWDKDNIASKNLLITNYDSSERALAAFDSGKIDIMAEPPVSETRKLIEEDKAVSYGSRYGSFLEFNLRDKTLDSNLRNAIRYSINRNNIVENILNNSARVSQTYVPYDIFCSNYEYNPDKYYYSYYGDPIMASEYVSQSKYDKKNKLKLVYLNSLQNKKISESIAKNIRESLDINVEAKGFNIDELKDVLKKGQYNILLCDYYESNDDTLTLIERYVSTSPLNLCGYKNIQYDDLYKKALAEKDENKRYDLVFKCEELLLNDAPVVPLYLYNIILCKNKNIEGIEVNSEGNIDITRVYIGN